MDFLSLFASAYRGLYRGGKPLMAALMIPTLGIMMVTVMLAQMQSLAGQITFQVIQLGFNAIISINVFRLILLGPGAIGGVFPSWGFRETLYFLHSLAILVLMLPLQVSMNLPSGVALITMFFVFWVILRIYLVFPAIAVDKGVTFKDSWHITQKHQPLMLLVVIATPLALSVFATAIAGGVNNLWIQGALLTIVDVYCTAMIALAYRWIIQQHYQRSQ